MKLTNNLDRIGTIGLFLTALATTCCFPLFAFVLSAFGLGSAELFGGYTKYIFEGLVAISLAGLFISYRQHRSTYPLLVAIPSAAIIFYGYSFNDSDNWNKFIYTGMFGLFAATIFSCLFRFCTSVTAINATVALLWFQNCFALFALVKKLTSICWHNFFFLVSAIWTSDC